MARLPKTPGAAFAFKLLKRQWRTVVTCTSVLNSSSVALGEGFVSMMAVGLTLGKKGCIYEHLLIIIYLYLFSLYINVFLTTWINNDTCVIFPVTSLSINGRLGTERLRIYDLLCRFDHGGNVWYGEWLMWRQVNGWVLVCLWVRPKDDMRSWETDCWNCCIFSICGVGFQHHCQLHQHRDFTPLSGQTVQLYNDDIS